VYRQKLANGQVRVHTAIVEVRLKNVPHTYPPKPENRRYHVYSASGKDAAQYIDLVSYVQKVGTETAAGIYPDTDWSVPQAGIRVIFDYFDPASVVP
jgi:hypothetical protein